MPPDYNLLEYHRGTITAPAGCGKTQIIADTLALYTGARPVLILTHTNAGVATLRLRMQRAGVSTAAYRIATIDGFAMRLVAMFPARSGLNAEVLQLRNRGTDYPAIRLAACQLLQAGHLNDVLPASYVHLIVDEYQDCNLVQHAMVTALSTVLPACVLGDPMQAIFGFRGNQLVNWDAHVLAHFPLIGELNHPWRWANSGAPELGRWLLDCRRMLLNGNAIDLRQVPAEVAWVPLQAETAVQQRLTAAQTRAVTATGQVLVIGNSYDTRGRQQMASQTPGATTVEAVDLVDLTDFGAGFNLRLRMR